MFERDLAVSRGDLDALPRTKSVAQYVTRCSINRQRFGRLDIDWLILGTPIYVAQVAMSATV